MGMIYVSQIMEFLGDFLLYFYFIDSIFKNLVVANFPVILSRESPNNGNFGIETVP